MHSICSTIGGRHPGVCTELIYSVNDNVGVICGYSHTASPSAHASISVWTVVPITSGEILPLDSDILVLTSSHTDRKIEAERRRDKVRGSVQSRRSAPRIWPAMVLSSDEQRGRVLIPHCSVVTAHTELHPSKQTHKYRVTHGSHVLLHWNVQSMLCIRLGRGLVLQMIWKCQLKSSLQQSSLCW